jgi:predicted RNase H-like nuclease (RuvC/YqgF family)
MCELAREMQRVKGRNLELEAQAEQVEDLQKQIADQTTTITQLKQDCSVRR